MHLKNRILRLERKVDDSAHDLIEMTDAQLVDLIVRLADELGHLDLPPEIVDMLERSANQGN